MGAKTAYGYLLSAAGGLTSIFFNEPLHDAAWYTEQLCQGIEKRSVWSCIGHWETMRRGAVADLELCQNNATWLDHAINAAEVLAAHDQLVAKYALPERAREMK